MNSDSGIHRLLDYPKVFATMRRATGGHNYHAALIRDHIRPQAGARVLDLGCGTGQMSHHLAVRDYVGVDWNPRYVEYAARRAARHSSFHRADLSQGVSHLGHFDVALALGVLHHLSDPAAIRLLGTAAQAVADTGYLVTADTSVADNDPRLTRWLASVDRGRHVRSPVEYYLLALEVFAEVTVSVRRDLLQLFPGAHYTTTVLECRKPIRN